MKIWKMTNPHDEQFALADVCGVWGKIGKPCPECASSAQHRVQPLIVEWESGSDVIGDFIWTLSGTAPIVIRSVCEDLNSRFGGFECGPVVMKWDKKFERPAKPNPRARKRVWLPYEGPPLCELWITKKVHIDPERTTAKLMERCGTCARERWEIQCVEWHKEGALDFLDECPEWYRRKLNPKNFEPVDVVRVPGAGMFVSERDLGEASVFETYEFGWAFCTDDVKRFIEERKYTNVTFWEFGEVVD